MLKSFSLIVAKNKRVANLIAFLPRHSTRAGWVTFETDPRTVEEMKARVLGLKNLDVDVPCNSCEKSKVGIASPPFSEP